MRISFFWIVFLAGFFSANFVSASVYINEVAWMGSSKSHADEWIELKNYSDSQINLDGWELKTADGSLEIELSGTITAQDFYLLERTDQQTLPDIEADLIYTGALGNQGEKLELYDASGSLQDSLDASQGWPSGNNETKQTMEKSAEGWQTSLNPGGTPKSENSQGEKEPAVEEKPENLPSLVESKGDFKIFLIAAATALFSAAAVLKLKKNQK